MIIILLLLIIIGLHQPDLQHEKIMKKKLIFFKGQNITVSLNNTFIISKLITDFIYYFLIKYLYIFYNK